MADFRRAGTVPDGTAGNRFNSAQNIGAQVGEVANSIHQ